ncbi:MAG: PspC domain-containing protein [Bacteroidales bacterium]|jgi:phage shock protein PspC (stress-responsive transcriptional regulator)
MMEKTININLGGTLFSIDEEAYHILRDYLQAISNKFKNVQGGNETIEDIEFRIAEIFRSLKITTGVISKENVGEMIKIIGRPEDFDQAGSETVNPGPTYTYQGTNKRMFRHREDSIIGGVCSGIGTYLDTDPVWIRIVFVIFAFFCGLGILLYLALWIAIPSAGNDYRNKETDRDFQSQAFMQDKGSPRASNLGRAINEIFIALGKFLFVIVRIFLILIGLILVLTGFVALLAFLMTFIFRYPGAFSTEFFGMNALSFSQFLGYIINPAMVIWVKVLIIALITLPLLAIIYGGIRLIFWFRARDRYLWLSGFVLWVVSAVALSIILFNEGLSWNTEENSVTRESFSLPADTLYIEAGRKLSDLSTSGVMALPGKRTGPLNYFMMDEKKEAYFGTRLDIASVKENSGSLEIRRHSAGRDRSDAIGNSKRLSYNYTISHDTICLDEFFTIPSGTKWSFDFVSLRVQIPESTVICIDEDIAETILKTEHGGNPASLSGKGFWKITPSGSLRCISGK